jgi:hypothetical protein
MGKKTDPKKQVTPLGHEIPVPKKGEFFDNLKKASKPSPTEKESDPDASRKKEKE